MPSFAIRTAVQSLILFFSLIAFDASAQGITVDREGFRDQMLSVIHVKLLEKYDEIITRINKEIPESIEGYADKRINEIEKELLKVSNFSHLLYEFNDLGISAEDPQLSRSLRNVANDVVKFLNTEGPITREELSGYFDRWWKPSATLIMDKESAEILEKCTSLMSQAQDRFNKLRQIQIEFDDLEEAEFVKVLEQRRLPKDILKRIEPLEQVLRSGWRDVPDPVANYNLLHGAFTSKDPSRRIEVLFELGAKYGDKVPIIGQFITPMFELAREMLNAAYGLGKMLAANFNQGCIYTDGLYNVQKDPKSFSFLQKFPSTEVCPIYYPVPEVKRNKRWKPTSSVRVPPVYQQCYFNVLDENELYFYVKGKWFKGKKSPSHNGIDDVKAIVGWLRTNGMADKAMDPELVYQMYNNSPGFMEFRKRAGQAVAGLKEKLFSNPGALNTLNAANCDPVELEQWFNRECGLRNLDILFPKNDQPDWEDYTNPFGRMWSELSDHLIHCEFNQYVKDKNYLFQSAGIRPMTEMNDVLDRLDFYAIELYGRVYEADGSPGSGIRVKFERSHAIYPGRGYCQQDYADSKGRFHFFYIKKGTEAESRFVVASDLSGNSAERDVEIDPTMQRAHEIILHLAGEPVCPDGYLWDEINETCVIECVANAHSEMRSGVEICVCDDGYEWNSDYSECLQKDETAIEAEEEEEEEEENDSGSEEESADDAEEDEADNDENEPALDDSLCADFPNTMAVRNPENGGILCDCRPGYVWNEDGSACITERESLISRADCSAYPNTVAVWSQQDNMVICDCKPGFAFNEDGNCEPTDASVFSGADCSFYSNTRPVWSNEDQQVVCDCREGYVWKDDMSGCERRDMVQQCADAYPNTRAVWDRKDQTYYCECLPGYEWNKSETGCVMTEQLAVANSDCSRYPNTITKWNGRTQSTYCVCRTGYMWNAGQTGCVKDPQFDENMSDLVDALIQLGSGDLTGVGGSMGGGGGVDSPDDPVVAPENQHEGECNTTYSGKGENVAEQYSIPITGSGNSFSLSYDMRTVRDRIHVYFNGYKIYDSGCATGSDSVNLQLDAFFGGTLTVIVDPRCDSSEDTIWSFQVTCK